MITNEPGVTTEPVPAPPRSHRSAVWFMVVFCAGLMLLVALNMK
jgi:hypothetical protein